MSPTTDTRNDGPNSGAANLPSLLNAVASALEGLDGLVPLAIAMRPEDSTVDISGAMDVPLADQRVSVDRLAAALQGSAPALRPVGAAFAYGIRADLPGGIGLTAVASTPARTSRGQERVTSTQSTVAMLRSLVAWASTLDPRQVSELLVSDRGSDHSVLLALQDSADPVKAVESVTASLPVQIDRAGGRVYARGILPPGYSLRVVAHLA